MLQSVPVNVQERIFSNLSGVDLLRISTTHTTLNRLLSSSNTSLVSINIWRSATINSFPETGHITKLDCPRNDGEESDESEGGDETSDSEENVSTATDVLHGEVEEDYFYSNSEQFRRMITRIPRDNVDDWMLFPIATSDTTSNPWRSLWTILAFNAQSDKNKLKKYFQSEHSNNNVTLGRYITALNRIKHLATNINSDARHKHWEDAITDSSDLRTPTNPYLMSMYYYTLIEYVSTLDWSTEIYKWNMIYVILTRIVVIGRNNVSAEFTFVGESTHCYEDCEDRYVLYVDFVDTVGVLSRVQTFSQKNVPTVELLEMAKKDLALEDENVDIIVDVLGLREVGVTSQELRSFLKSAMVPKGSFVGDTVSEYSSDASRAEVNIYSRTAW
ncbi:hypothetical protein BJ742DRAFT_811737 [Cladochytrium replicatum]|nr:hypothetical protein BJ742DRAFT_811737 [Cladochytrium replicatum]